jgi:hypothetical protein
VSLASSTIRVLDVGGHEVQRSCRSPEQPRVRLPEPLEPRVDVFVVGPVQIDQRGPRSRPSAARVP